MLTPVDNPTAYGLVETDADGNIQRFLEKPKPDEITCDTINAGIYVLEPDTFDRIPKDTPWSIERSFFPSLIERGETFVAYVYRGYWIDIGTPEKYMQVHRDIMDGRYRGARRSPAQPATAVDLARGARRGRRDDRRALLHRRRRGRQGRRADRPVQRDRPAVPHRGARASSSGSIVWAEHAGSARRRVVRGSILGRHCHIGRNAVVERRRRARRQVASLTDYSRALSRLSIDDVESRHLQGLRRPRPLSRRDQRRRRARDRRGVRRVSRSAKRIAVGARHAPLVAGARRRVHRRRDARRAPTSSTTA